MSRAREFADLAGSADAGGLTGRNMIINGAMQVHQRGGTATMNNNQSYSLDRFQGFASAGGTYTITQDSDTPSGEGFINSLKVAVTSADSSLASGDYYVIDQRIEGNVLAQAGFGTSGAKAVTLSFFVRSSVTGSHGGSLSNNATNRSYPYTYTVSSANTWEYKTITIPGDTTGTWLTTTGIGARLYWGLGAGSAASGPAGAWAAAEYRTAASTVAPISTGSATWYITGIQLELGEQATPFEHRSFADELLRCQRYAVVYTAASSGNETFIGSGTTIDADDVLVVASLPNNIRATPTVTFTNFGVRTAASSTYNNTINGIYPPVGGNTIGFNIDSADTPYTAGQAVLCVISSGSSNHLTLDAEL